MYQKPPLVTSRRGRTAFSRSRHSNAASAIACSTSLLSSVAPYYSSSLYFLPTPTNSFETSRFSSTMSDLPSPVTPPVGTPSIVPPPVTPSMVPPPVTPSMVTPPVDTPVVTPSTPVVSSPTAVTTSPTTMGPPSTIVAPPSSVPVPLPSSSAAISVPPVSSSPIVSSTNAEVSSNRPSASFRNEEVSHSA